MVLHLAAAVALAGGAGAIAAQVVVVEVGAVAVRPGEAQLALLGQASGFGQVEVHGAIVAETVGRRPAVGVLIR